MASIAMRTTTTVGLRKPTWSRCNEKPSRGPQIRARPRQLRVSKSVTVYAATAEAVVEGRMECINPMRDSWELVKSTGERLSNESNVINECVVSPISSSLAKNTA
eukprot:978390-Prorocentrum_minimum.AAC.6